MTPQPTGSTSSPTELQTGAPATLSPRVRDRIEAWKSELLDLTKRNPLINFRRDGKRPIALAVENVSSLEDKLADGTSFEIVPAAIDGKSPSPRTGANLLRAPLTAEQLFARAVMLDRETRRAVDEGGAWTCYLALGSLCWVDAKDSVQPRYAPILLVPVTIEIDRARRRVLLQRHDDETIANPSLIEMLKREHGIDVDELRELREDASGVDVPYAFTVLREAVALLGGWSVVEDVHVATFSFHKLIMWRDLQAHGADLLADGLARRIAEPSWPLNDVDTAGAPLAVGNLDASVRADALPLVLDADSSQIAAVEYARRGASFVLEGPPGTGKSQTITNIIAATLEAGRRVLFVSEKMAALTVVQSRLESVGLGPFCLELHAHASAQTAALRRGVVESIERARREVDTVSKDDPRDAWTRQGDKIHEHRERLNGHVEMLHAMLPVGVSFRQGRARLRSAALNNAPTVAIATSALDAFDKKSFERASDALAELAHATERVSPLANHPLRASSAQTLDILDLGEALTSACEALERVEDAGQRLHDALGLDLPAQPAALREWAERLRDGARVVAPSQLRSDDSWTSLSREVTSAANRHSQLATVRGDLATRWTDGIYERLELEPILRKWASVFWLIAWFALWRVRRMLQREARGRLPNRRVLANDFATAIAADGETRALSVVVTDLQAAIVPAAARDIPALATLFAEVDRLRQTARGRDVRLASAIDQLLVEQPTSMLRTRVSKAAVELIAGINAAADAFDRLDVGVGLDPLVRRAALEERWLDILRERVRTWEPRLREWCAFRERGRAVRDLGLDEIVVAVDSMRLAPKDVVAAFERAVLDRQCKRFESRTPHLAGFESAEHEGAIERFRRQDRDVPTHARRVVCSKLREYLPPRVDNARASSEAATLERELRKKTRHMPLRKLVAALPTLLPQLKPCMLMSPLSVAQYLPPTRGQFDLVIFDEASQITVADAIGAIARARQVIVVGDPKQMPPSKFFQRGGEEEPASDDENADADLESILDQVATSRVQRLQLNWHYRSRHESLIAFSNATYYGDRLNTFPSADCASADLGVTRTFLERGTYLGEGKNMDEAQALVDVLAKRLREHAPNARSFGVVTFSLPQRTLIENLIDKLRETDLAIEAHFAPGLREPVFIKNLENVQGDERDEILFSTTYGPGADRRVRQNFGPLVGAGGGRRLNVAVTRAKLKMHVFTCLRSTDITTPESRSDGVRDFAAFLRYVENGAVLAARGESKSDAFDSEFERQVFDEITRLGHSVETQVGASSYRIDLAVVDPNDPGRFLLGIECDGAAYHSGATARDRDRPRQDVLEGLGWRLFRIWSTDWWYRRAAVVERLQSAIRGALDSAVIGAHAESATGVRPSVDNTQVEASSERPPPSRELLPVTREDDRTSWRLGEMQILRTVFNPALPDPMPWAPDEYFDRASTPRVARAITQTLELHGPLLVEDVARLFLQAHGGRRLTEKWGERTREVCKTNPALFDVVDGFVWSREADPATYRSVRVPRPGAQRDVAGVPLEELAMASVAVLIDQGSMDTADVAREVVRLFGIARAHETAVSRAARGVERALSAGFLARDQGRLSVRRA